MTQNGRGRHNILAFSYTTDKVTQSKRASNSEVIGELSSSKHAAIFVTQVLKASHQMWHLNTQIIMELFSVLDQVLNWPLVILSVFIIWISLEGLHLSHHGTLIGIPLHSMLGKITRDLGTIFKKLQGKLFNCEYKHDEQHAQIHMDANEKVTIFSRYLKVI